MSKSDSIKLDGYNCLKVLKVGKPPYNSEIIIFDRITSIK